ncbi:MAG: hypothetical protein D6693_04745 [Planctomycetota bacterium]|nr:MAG: hypothetical protein D6693_04745 [Planctomycetota bacterium]
MPPEMKDLLRGLARDGADASPDAPASGGAQATRETGGPYTALRARGLPAGAMTVRLDGAEARVRVIDAGGLVNVNRAPRDGLARFFEARGLSSADAAALADQIADWRDEDSVPREFGAERDDYRARGVQIRNGPIRTLEELLYLPAMTRERFDLVREDLTLVGDGRVTATTAPRAVLLSVPGMTPDAADAILSARRAGALRTLADLDEAVDRFTAGAVETGLRLDPTSHLRILVTPAGGGPTLAVEALVSDDRGVRILGWGPAGPGAAGLP